MKFGLLFASVLLLAGCSRRDTKLRDQITGIWMRDDSFEMALGTDGGFVSRWTQPTKSLTYQGTWKIQDGDVIFALTNCIAQGTTNFQAVGSVDSWVIVRLDRSDLVWSNGG